jgi:hypothetical protein
MDHHSIVANSLSRLDIRREALLIRKTFGFDKQLYFPIIRFVELILPQLMPEFVFDVASEDELGDCHGLTYPERHLMRIREDVYLRADEGIGRDRATIAHELGHYILHQPSRVAHARIEFGATLPAFKSPEWQAKAFAGELLVPAHLVKGMKSWEVVKLCGVSQEAAELQLNKI